MNAPRAVPSIHRAGSLYRLRAPCGRSYYGHTGGTPGYVAFAAGSRHASRLVVVAVNGVDPYALEVTMGRLVDELLRR